VAQVIAGEAMRGTRVLVGLFGCTLGVLVRLRYVT